jgi:hypothetical protein
MAIPITELQTRVDDLKRAYLSGVKNVRFSDGKSQEFQDLPDMLKAIEAGEDWIREASGLADSRCSFAQHKRGDGPSGPDLFDHW